ncbi:MAG: glycosyltransferase family 4 protein [Burkholderiales bacterium]
MTFPFALLTALLIGMTAIPLMIKLAPRLRMVDMPDPRKVHALPIPRVGGVGMVAGAVVSLLLWLPVTGWLPWYLMGALVLFIFGAWDDSREIGHYTKFIGQFAATAAVVYGGDLYVKHLPFLGEAIDPAVGRLFTVVALVGMINAINHSDGLDGLAGGESLMSLGCLAYLGYLGGGTDFLVVAGAVIGGLFGFLRYNAHPARVFMGDAGSQFLGFSLGVLAVSLTQEVMPGVSMALPLLILGLPIVDIIAVFAQRIHGGMNWFRATKNHIHHRLLELGYAHPQAVLLIYCVQAFLVLSAIALRYESDVLVLAVYAVVCALVFGVLAIAEHKGWRVRRKVRGAPVLLGGNLGRLPFAFVWLILPLYFLLGGVMAREVTGDIGMAGAVVACISVAGLLLSWRSGGASMLLRLGVFSAAALLVYTMERQGGPFESLFHPVMIALAVAVGLAIRLSAEQEFRTTPLDYLMVLLVVVTGVLAQRHFDGFNLGAVIVQLVVLFYSYELVASKEKGFGSRLAGAGACCAGVMLAGRALL